MWHCGTVPANGCFPFHVFSFFQARALCFQIQGFTASTHICARWLRNGVVHWYLCTTDGGSNEVGARRIIHSDIKDVNNAFFFDTTCVQHSQHLISLSALKAADRNLKGVRDWKYFSSLAVCTNVCRDVSKKLFGAWTAAHGFPSAKTHVKTLFPKAVAGRWSGCDRPEQRFLQCGQDRLAPVLTSVLKQKTDSKDPSEKATESKSVNDIAIEESKEYSIRMGKWRRRCIECVSDRLWWQCVEVMNVTRSVLSHLSNFLHKQDVSNHVYELCTWKAAALFQELDLVWPHLRDSNCVTGEGDEAQFVRDFATPA